MANWYHYYIKSKYLLYENNKSCLFKVPNSNYKFWHPAKIVKHIPDEDKIKILYTDNFKFRLFKSKKENENWINYDEKIVRISGLKEIIEKPINLKLKKGHILAQTEKAYLFGYMDMDRNFFKFWVNKDICYKTKNEIWIYLKRDEKYKRITIDDNFEEKTEEIDSIDLYVHCLSTQLTLKKLSIELIPDKLVVPKNITIDKSLKDDDNNNYNEIGLLQTKTKLFLHQQKAVAKVLPAKYSALFMDMGTGKTRTTIEILKIRQNKYRKVFWITPVSLKHNILLEFLKHTNLSRKDIYLFDDKTNDKTIINQNFIIVGIESIASSDRVYLSLEKMIKDDDFIVVDESSFIKGNTRRVKRVKRIIELTKNTKYRMILTGTPISQGIVDLYSQMYFLSPKILGYKNFYQFAKNHLEYDKHIVGRIISEHNEDYIAAKINPYVYQVSKEECLDLKEKNYIENFFTMSCEQEHLYNNAKEKFFEQFLSYDIDSIFPLFNELQQIASGFRYKKDGEIQIIDKRRAIFLSNILKEIGIENKVIIWTKYRADIMLIREILEEEFGINSFVIYDGTLNEKEKNQTISKFRVDMSIRFFVAMQSTGAFGLNLTEANYAIFYNNSFKYSQRIQAEDRIYRIGQNRHVVYIDIICWNSIDKTINSVLHKKKNVVEYFRNEVNSIKDKKLKKSILDAIIKGDLDKIEKIKKIANKSSAAKRMEKMRRKRGVIPREEYLKKSLSHKQPWKELGISRATWYRRYKTA